MADGKPPEFRYTLCIISILPHDCQWRMAINFSSVTKNIDPLLLVFGFFHVEGLSGLKSGLVSNSADMVNVFVDIFCQGTRALN